LALSDVTAEVILFVQWPINRAQSSLEYNKNQNISKNTSIIISQEWKLSFSACLSSSLSSPPLKPLVSERELIEPRLLLSPNNLRILTANSATIMAGIATSLTFRASVKKNPVKWFQSAAWHQHVNFEVKPIWRHFHLYTSLSFMTIFHLLP